MLFGEAVPAFRGVHLYNAVHVVALLVLVVGFVLGVAGDFGSSSLSSSSSGVDHTSMDSLVTPVDFASDNADVYPSDGVYDSGAATTTTTTTTSTSASGSGSGSSFEFVLDIILITLAACPLAFAFVFMEKQLRVTSPLLHPTWLWALVCSGA